MFVAALFAPGPARGMDVSSLPERPVTHLDTLRAEMTYARIRFDGARFAEVAREIRRLDPADLYPLRDYAIRASDCGGLESALATLPPAGTGFLPAGLKVTEPEVEFLRALLQYYRGRVATALPHFDRALELRPGSGWILYYRGRAKEVLLRPRAECEADFQAALGDSEVVPVVLSYLARRRYIPDANPDATVAEAYRLFLGRYAVPWLADKVATRLVEDSLETVALTLEGVEGLWQRIDSRDPLFHLGLCGPVAWWVSQSLPSAEAQEFLRRRVTAEPPSLARARWTGRLAGVLQEDLRPALSDSFLASTGCCDGTCWTMRALYAVDAGDRPALEERLARSWGETLDPWDVGIFRNKQMLLGDQTRAQACLDSLRRESPGNWIRRRIDGLEVDDPQAALAVLDSLRAAGVEFEADAKLRRSLGERVGDTLAVSEAVRGMGRGDASMVLVDMATSAVRRGDHGRCRRLIERAAAIHPRDTSILRTAMRWLALQQDPEGVLELANRIDRISPNAAFDQLAIIEEVKKVAPRTEVRPRIRRIAALPEASTEILAQLAYHAMDSGDQALADSLITRAEAKGPGRAAAVMARAVYLKGRNDLKGARDLVEPLAQQFPGASNYRRLLQDSGGEPPIQPQEQGQADDLASSFAGFDNDLESIDRIKAARVVPDSFPGHDAVILEERVSVVIGRLDRYPVRTHRTVQILREEALERHQPFRISFLPMDGAPEIRAARVIQPDGSVTEVPRSDIIVSGATEGGTVNDAKVLVIPLPGLRVGSILDVVWDHVESGMLASGWSMRYLPGDYAPVRVSGFDVKALPGLRLSVRQEETVPAPATSTETGWEFRRWTWKDLPAIRPEAASLGVYRDYPWVGISTHASWDQLFDPYRKEFWERAVISGDTRRFVAELIRGSRNDEETFARIRGYLAGHVKYLAIEIGRGRIVPTPADTVLTRGFGDCKDMVALLAAMLDAAGVESSPTLLSSRSDADLRRDFAEPEFINHVLLYLPTLRSGTFYDATLGDSCRVGLPPSLAGESALILPRNAPAVFTTLPAARAEDHGMATEIDLYPVSDQFADVRVRSTYRGVGASVMRQALGAADTAAVAGFVEREFLPSRWSTLLRRSWKTERDDCDGVVLSGVFQDTAWASQRHTVGFSLPTRVPFFTIEFPEAEEREHAVRLEAPFSSTGVIRLHAGADWEPVPQLPTVTVTGPGYTGRIDAKEQRDGEDHWVEVRQAFTLDRQNFSVEEYRAFRKDWIRFLVGVFQSYRYRRVPDEAKTKRIEAYAAAHPEDGIFAVNAAGEILGADMGGEGDAGKERRNLVRRLLQAPATSPDAGPEAFLYLAFIAMKDGTYQRADSLLAAASARALGDPMILNQCRLSKRQLGRVDQEVELLGRLRERGGRGVDLALVEDLYTLDRPDDARAVEERFFALNSLESDTTEMLEARYLGWKARSERTEAEKALADLAARSDPDTRRTLESDFYIQYGDVEKAIPLLEKMWDDNPLNHMICNNLAWGYVLAGRNLDRADDLLESSIMLAPDDVSMRNTLGALYARRGEWSRARDLFRDVRDSDDRPQTFLVNEFFIGICEWELGRKEEARSRWQTVVERGAGAPRERDWVEKSRQCLERADQGREILSVIFFGVGE
jgi:tetratricopeptide (TPR) repeat protein